MSEPAEPRRGRRPGRPDTRGDILAAARRRFEDHGFDATTIRGVARDADVDPALVHHYFGDKAGLLIASLRLGFDPRRLIDRVAGTGLEGLGPRIVATALTVYASPLGAALAEAIRREPAVVPSLLHVFVGQISARAEGLLPDVDAAQRRERIAVLQDVMSGLVVGRVLVQGGPLAELERDRVVAIFGPILQAALEGRLTGGDAPRRR